MRPVVYFVAFWASFLIGLAVLLWSVPARAQDEAKGAALSALIEEKCAEGCAVLSVDEMEALKAQVREWVIQAHKQGQLSCRNAT